ncbi:MAG TPA: hypothetical protein VIO57_10085 [Chloroflexota bacterium]|jgi:hypothetical protein
MNTLDKWAMKNILHRLSLIESNQDFLASLYPSLRQSACGSQNKIWVNEIRNLLLDAALSDIAVEPSEAKKGPDA